LAPQPALCRPWWRLVSPCVNGPIFEARACCPTHGPVASRRADFSGGAVHGGRRYVPACHRPQPHTCGGRHIIGAKQGSMSVCARGPARRGRPVRPNANAAHGRRGFVVVFYFRSIRVIILATIPIAKYAGRYSGRREDCTITGVVTQHGPACNIDGDLFFDEALLAATQVPTQPPDRRLHQQEGPHTMRCLAVCWHRSYSRCRAKGRLLLAADLYVLP
jgi:hypothetical protein